MAWVRIAVECNGEVALHLPRQRLAWRQLPWSAVGRASVDILPLGGRLELGDEKCGGSKRALCDRVRRREGYWSGPGGADHISSDRVK